MKIKYGLLTILFLLLFTVSVFAEMSIKAEVDKTSITTDDRLTYKLVITSPEKNIPIPSIPKFAGFAVVSQAQSSTVSFAKGSTTTQVIYVFVLLPRQAGKLKIEASKIKAGIKTYTSEQFEIEVTQGKVKPQIPQQQETPKEKKFLPESEESQVTL